MRIPVAVVLTFALTCCAQQPRPLTSERLSELAAQQLANRVTGSCPVGLTVRQQAMPPLLYTNSARAVHPAYRIDVLSNSGKQVHEVAVQLVGPTGPHLEQIDTFGHRIDSKENIVLAKLSNTHVRTRRLTAVRWVDVISVAYADGSSWVPQDKDSCRVMPQSVRLLQ